MRILIIDDSQVMRDLLQEFLDAEGYDAHVIDNPIEGTKMALTEEWSMIICDTHMPQKNGYEVYTDIIKEKPSLLFLLTDSLPEEMAFVKNRVEGNYYYLKKPFELDQIREILNTCLQVEKTK